MQMSHFSVDLQHSLTRFHKPAMDPTQTQSLLSEGHVVPTSPHDKEALFEKPLTPSDVGKLNRLVIPKQYAEKYFPLGGGSGGDAAGTLLGFEDEAGKCWRFRYSYWNSSQSYVLTKGWSRYVKEKALDAGDVVVFERHRAEPDRLFIGWRRRGVPQLPTPFGYNAQGYGTAQDSRGSAHGAHPYQAEPRRVAGVGPAEQEEQRTPGIGNTNSTRLVRLFGVNFECQLSRDQSSSGTTSSQGSSQQPIRTQQHSHQEAYRNYFNHMGLPPNHRHQHHHMELEFTQGAVEQMGNRLG